TGGVYVQVIAAETLKQGRPVDVGWGIPYLLAVATATLALLRKRLLHRSLIVIGGTAYLVFLPIVLEAHLIFVDVTPALFVLITVGTALLWRRYRLRGF